MDNAQCTTTSNNEEVVEAVKKVSAMKRKANSDGENKEKKEENKEKPLTDGEKQPITCWEAWVKGNMKENGPKLYSEWAKSTPEKHAVLSLAIGLGFEKLRDMEIELEKVDPSIRKQKYIETALYMWKVRDGSNLTKNISTEKIADMIILTLERISKYRWPSDMKLAFHMLVKTIKQ